MRHGLSRSLAVALSGLILLAPGASHAFVEPPLWNTGWHLGSAGGGPGTAGVGSFSRPSWLAIRFRIDQRQNVTFSAHADLANTSSAGLMAWMVRGGGVVGAPEAIIFRNRFANVVYAKVTFPPPPISGVTIPPAPIVDMFSGGGAFSGDVTQSYTLDPGTYTGVAIAAADGSVEGNAKLESSGVVDVLNATVGQNVFLRDERDFTGLADVYVQQAPSIRAKAMVLCSRQETATHSMFGWFGTVNDPGAMLHSDGPDGHRDGLQIYSYSNAPVGAYTMSVDADAGSVASATGSFGADVTMP